MRKNYIEHRLGTSKKEQKINQMGTIAVTLSKLGTRNEGIEPAKNKERELMVSYMH